MTRTIAVVNGPNLNMLGKREVDIYGGLSLDDICHRIQAEAGKLNVRPIFYQSNSEGELASYIQSCRETADGIVLNAGAYTHYSVTLRDAVSACEVPTVEVHISNIYKRESFRHVSLIAPVCVGQICGLGTSGYLLAMRALVDGRPVQAGSGTSTEKKRKNLLVVSGPNLNLLGTRDVSIYGTCSLEDIHHGLRRRAGELGVSVECVQFNSEGAMVDCLQEAAEKYDGVIINPAALAHYSYALRSAISTMLLPTVQVYISNVHAREEFRHKSVIADVCLGVVGGFGENSYLLALEALCTIGDE
jgi:3-dehydroquinate dehydratase-2